MPSGLPTPVGERRTEITDYFLSKLNVDAALEAIRARDVKSYEQLIKLPRHKPGFKRFLINRLAISAPALLEPTGLRAVGPPAAVHSVSPGQLAGDLYFPDLFAELVVENGLSFPPGSAALDFGSSSGRVVRNLALYYPDRVWFGCDPRARSIEWAAEAFPNVRFFVNQEAPPLPGIEPGFFTATIAISVWSHFSAMRALEWFSAIAAVTRPGGFLLFSSLGKCSVRHYLQKQKMTASIADPIVAKLDSGEYVFNLFGEKNEEQKGLDFEHWGVSFVPRSWYERECGRWWTLKEYLPGRAMGNQDVYVLVRKDA